jgi:hypothetical protein
MVLLVGPMLSVDNITVCGRLPQGAFLQLIFLNNLPGHHLIPAVCILLVFLITCLWSLEDLYWYYLHNSSSDLILEALFIWLE